MDPGASFDTPGTLWGASRVLRFVLIILWRWRRLADFSLLWKFQLYNQGHKKNVFVNTKGSGANKSSVILVDKNVHENSHILSTRICLLCPREFFHPKTHNLTDTNVHSSKPNNYKQFENNFLPIGAFEICCSFCSGLSCSSHGKLELLQLVVWVVGVTITAAVLPFKIWNSG